MKIWEKVNNLTGYDSKSRVLVELLNQSAKFLVSSLPEKFLWSIASEETIEGWDTDGNKKIGNGSGTAYDKVIAIYRFEGSKKRVASEVPDGGAYSFDEKSSLLRSTKMFPKYYRLADKIYIKPDPDYNSHNLSDNTCDLTSGSASVTMDSTSSLSVGMPISGNIVPAGTTVSSIESSTSFTMSANATQTGSNVTLTFGKSYTDIDDSTVKVLYGGGDKGVIIYAVPPVINENTSEWALVEFEHVAILYTASSDAKRKADLAAIEDDYELAAAYQSQAQDFYQRFVNEFQAVTGGLNAPPQQQQAHRTEEQAAT